MALPNIRHSLDELGKLRIESFSKIVGAISDVKQNVLEAGQANKDALDKESLLDLFNKWNNVTVQDARAKGHKEGYAEACEHLIPAINQIMETVSSEVQSLQRSLEELEAKISNVPQADSDGTLGPLD